MADVFVDRILQEAGILDKDFQLITDDKLKKGFGETYELIIEVLKDYCDIEEKYYSLIAIWIIGTYFHDNFPTYPYLFFNAMKGSGKSRVLRLIALLSKDGELLNSLTEAVLFRTKGTLGIDEFESISKKGNENLKELLNSAYKKGIKVKRMRKVHTKEGEEQQVEEFDVYRPIIMANIRGMDEVLNDRCISIILEKSNKLSITKKMELYDNDTRILGIHSFLLEQCSKCIVYTPENIYKEWNNYININYTNYTHYNNSTNSTNYTKEEYLSFFNKLNESGINGRNLELAMPLLVIASSLNIEIFDSLLDTFKEIIEEKKKEDLVESIDISLIDFISQELNDRKWIQVKELFQKFKGYVQVEDDWFNEKWFGRALRRLKLTKDKKRMSYGVLVVLDVPKAQEKIKMFR